jgi:2Fe-2S ferredoxin
MRILKPQGPLSIVLVDHSFPDLMHDKTMANITWKMEDGSEITVDVNDGLSLMEAATANNVPHIEGECGGCLSCATCHVFVDPDWFAKTGEIDEIEDTMLEMTDVERRDNSRLSCQITASPELEGLILYVPEP